MRILGAGLALVSLFFASAWAPVSGDETSARRRILSEYPGAVSRLQTRLSHARGNATLEAYTDEAPSGPEKEKRDPARPTDAPPGAGAESILPGHIRTTRISFAIDGKLKKLTRTSIDHRQLSKSGPVETTSSFCVGSDYSFQLLHPSGDGQPVLNNFAKAHDGDFRTSFDAGFLQYLLAPCSAVGKPIAELLDDPSFSIKKVSEVEVDGDECIRIDYEKTADEKPAWQRPGWFVVSPRRSWSVVSWWLASTRDLKHSVSGTVEYRPSPSDGEPQPERVTIRLPLGGRHVFTFDRLELGPVPPDEFTLAAFGLPELQKPGKDRSRNYASFWLIASAFGALAIAISLKYLAARTRRA